MLGISSKLYDHYRSQVTHIYDLDLSGPAIGSEPAGGRHMEDPTEMELSRKSFGIFKISAPSHFNIVCKMEVPRVFLLLTGTKIKIELFYGKRSFK
jgi:hypothetical protein